MPLKLSEMLLGGEQGSGEDNRFLRQDRYFWNDLNLWTPTITSPGQHQAFVSSVPRLLLPPPGIP